MIVDKVYAGDKPGSSGTTQEKAANNDGRYTDLPTTCYITTGAKVPDSYDCVVPVENCQLVKNGDERRLLAIDSTAAIQPNQWIRPAGCDIPAQSKVIDKDHVIDPIALGLLRQAACHTVSVHKPVKVGVLSTGN